MSEDGDSNQKRACSYDFKDPHKRSKGKAQLELRFKTEFKNTIFDACRSRPGWKQTTAELDWDFYWCDREWMFDTFDHVHLESWQRVNHYRNDRELCRKDLMVKNLNRMKKQLQKEKKTAEAEQWDFWPTTFVLPGDYALFAEAFKRNGGWWIMKPIGKSQGQGIFIIQKLSQITKWKADSRWKPGNSDAETYVVQRYIANPYLIAGRKFDLRIYALVTNFSPLTIYLYRSGFARFTNTRYSNAAADMMNQDMHLTNVAIQKKSSVYDKEFGGKWELSRLKLYLMSLHGRERIDQLFYEIQMIVIRALQSVQNVMINDKHCFELYGYDVMFDDQLKPWLIEVNASPSLSANTEDDYHLKVKMLQTMLDILDMERVSDGTEQSLGGFDLVHCSSTVPPDPNGTYTTLLGCEVPKQHMRPPRGSSSSKGGSKSTSSNVADPSGTPTTTTRRTTARGSGAAGMVRKLSTKNTGASTSNAPSSRIRGSSPLEKDKSDGSEKHSFLPKGGRQRSRIQQARVKAQTSAPSAFGSNSDCDGEDGE